MARFSRLDGPMADLQDQARSVALDLEPMAVEADAMDEVHPGVLAAIRQSGLMGLTVPQRYGGRYPAVDPLAVCVVREALMAVCSHADSLFALQGIGSFAITEGGTDEQRNEWLPKVATGEALAALALTEPVAGSDLKSLTTTATVDGDGSIVLDGTKAFISNAGAAAFYTVLAREPAGLSTFLVPADTEGLSTRPSPQLAAAHVLGDVTLDGVRLPPSARLGQPGGGLGLVLATLAVFRVSVAAASVGLAQTALDEAARHARDRQQFGRPLARLGPVAGLLADSWADVESARLVTYRAAELARDNPLAHLEHSSLAKLVATEACGRVVDRCVQVMGRWGLIRDSRIERCYRQARPMRVYEGATEVIRLGVARQLIAEVG